MSSYTNQRNPILPIDIHVPDCEAHVMPNGILYLYGSYDDRNDLYCSDKYHVVSTSDMLHWTIHDVALKGQQVPWFNNPKAPKYPGIDWSKPTPFILKMLEKDKAEGKDIKAIFEEENQKEKPPLLFAPDCIYKNGKYYLYFCMSDDSEGVAVSDRPEGPFAGMVQLPCGGIDPAIFLDDDGKGYFYWGQLFSHGVKLNEDMVSFDEREIQHNLVTEQEHYFHEGSSMRKIGDTYYYLYTDVERGKPTSLGYATSKSPMGPFVYRGIIIDVDGCDPQSWNNHGSIECMNGQWYVFYHRSSQNSQLHRRLCIEKIEILEDGTIPEVKTTSQGIGEPFGPGEMIYGYQSCWMSGDIYIGIGGPQGEWLTNISDCDQAVFRYVFSQEGFSQILIEGEGSGVIDVYLDEWFAGSVLIEEGCGRGNLKGRSGVKQELKFIFHKTEELKIVSAMLL